MEAPRAPRESRDAAAHWKCVFVCPADRESQTGLNGEEQCVSAAHLRQNLPGQAESFSVGGISALVLFDGPVHEAHVQSRLSSHPLT